MHRFRPWIRIGLDQEVARRRAAQVHGHLVIVNDCQVVFRRGRRSDVLGRGRPEQSALPHDRLLQTSAFEAGTAYIERCRESQVRARQFPQRQQGIRRNPFVGLKARKRIEGDTGRGQFLVVDRLSARHGACEPSACGHQGVGAQTAQQAALVTRGAGNCVEYVRPRTAQHGHSSELGFGRRAGPRQDREPQERRNGRHGTGIQQRDQFLRGSSPPRGGLHALFAQWPGVIPHPFPPTRQAGRESAGPDAARRDEAGPFRAPPGSAATAG